MFTKSIWYIVLLSAKSFMHFLSISVLLQGAKTFMHYCPFQCYCKAQKPSCNIVHFRVIARSKNLHPLWSISGLLQGAETFMHFDPFQGYCKEQKLWCILIHFRVIARSKNLHAIWSISGLLQGESIWMGGFDGPKEGSWAWSGGVFSFSYTNWSPSKYSRQMVWLKLAITLWRIKQIKQTLWWPNIWCIIR